MSTSPAPRSKLQLLRLLAAALAGALGAFTVPAAASAHAAASAAAAPIAAAATPKNPTD